jgi:hypothetical protein
MQSFRQQTGVQRTKQQVWGISPALHKNRVSRTLRLAVCVWMCVDVCGCVCMAHHTTLINPYLAVYPKAAVQRAA